MVRLPRRIASEAGYNLIELLLVIAIMGVLSGMAVIQIAASRPGLVGDGAARVIVGQVNQAREMAIKERKYMRVVFTPPNTVQVIREDTINTTTNISSALLEGGMAYQIVATVPDTPDLFGNGAAISFTGNPNNVKFTPEGLLVDQDGRTVNGSVFVAMANQSASARAITVLGSTGRIRLYKWNGKAWTLG